MDLAPAADSSVGDVAGASGGGAKEEKIRNKKTEMTLARSTPRGRSPFAFLGVLGVLALKAADARPSPQLRNVSRNRARD
jgi:hypothetical protein